MRFYHLIIAFLLISCSATNADEVFISNNWPDKSVLMDNFRSQDTVIIVYGKEDYALADIIVNGLSGIAAPNDRFAIITRRDDEISEAEVKNFPLYILGTKKNLILNRLNDNLPIHFIEGGFEFDGKKYLKADDIFKISFYPNMFNPNMPVTIISGNNEQNIIDFVQKQVGASWGYFYWDNWGYQIYANGKRAVLGNFSTDSAHLWSLDKKLHWDFNYSGDAILTTSGIQYFNHGNTINEQFLAAFNSDLQSKITALETMVGKKLNQPIAYHIYPKSELKALMLNNADQEMIDYEGNAIHAVITEEFEQKFSEAPILLASRNLLGKPLIMVLEEGLAVRITKNWQGADYTGIASKLANANALPGLKSLLLNSEFEGESDYLSHIAAASFVDFLINKFGQDVFLKNYLKWNSSSSELLSLEKDWYNYAKQFEDKSVSIKSSSLNNQAFLAGFNYAHEGYQVYNGYMGAESDQSISKLKSIGVNSLTIIPYSGFESLTKPHPINYTTGAGTENDASIIRAAYTAHQNGMSVMLKPQLWSWLGWTGEITMQNEADWNLFFAYYEKWIMHYALMAEIYRFEMFCIGVEFQNASLSEHNKWDALFDKVRTVYSGNITYAANWGAEFETVSFWDKLDFISVNCYYPLSAKTNPTDAELLSAFENNLNTIEKVHTKYNLPVVFTEIGFKSIASPWIAPHKDADEQDYNEDSQRRCYEVMIKAMADEPWIKGVYLWKWPSYMDFSKEYTKDFNPCNKQAEKTISKWFLEKQ